MLRRASKASNSCGAGAYPRAASREWLEKGDREHLVVEVLIGPPSFVRMMILSGSTLILILFRRHSVASFRRLFH